MDQTYVIIKKKLKGEKRGKNGHQNLSIYIKDETVEALNHIAYETDRSRNEIINILLEYGIVHHKIEKP